MTKELKTLIAEYEAKGWQVTETNHNHLRWSGPNGEMTFSGTTLSDWRAMKNIKSRLRREEERCQQEKS